ncbi:2OG-Fe dioxygenase family protein [Kitasatospora sp. NPDC018619]|uniref:2OG-Fe dioxygenase family protein n=1 Tax=unclassified Kitasatospora TaxID=2633591 RepID=UPI0037ADF56D
METALFQEGFERYDLARHFGGLPAVGGDYEALVRECAGLPADPYAPDSGRYRRYARGILFPWSGQLTWVPPATDEDGRPVHHFTQGDNNPEFADLRAFPAVAADVLDLGLLRRIVDFDFRRTRWDARDSAWPLHVGLHLIKQSVDHPGDEAVSSPNALHQDGNAFVFCHLVYRENAEGGNNVISEPQLRGRRPEALPEGSRLGDFTLTRPLEAYGIVDSMVTHYVAPLRKGAGEAAGERAVLIVGFTPMGRRLRPPDGGTGGAHGGRGAKGGPGSPRLTGSRPS